MTGATLAVDTAARPVAELHAAALAEDRELDRATEARTGARSAREDHAAVEAQAADEAERAQAAHSEAEGAGRVDEVGPLYDVADEAVRAARREASIAAAHAHAATAAHLGWRRVRHGPAAERAWDALAPDRRAAAEGVRDGLAETLGRVDRLLEHHRLWASEERPIQRMTAAGEALEGEQLAELESPAWLLHMDESSLGELTALQRELRRVLTKITGEER